MNEFEIEKAAKNVKNSQAEVEQAWTHLEDSLKGTTEKVNRLIEINRKYPGFIWAVAGAIGATFAIDYFSNRIDSSSSRGYNPLSPI